MAGRFFVWAAADLSGACVNGVKRADRTGGAMRTNRSMERIACTAVHGAVSQE
jgi:hypothetical protein